MAEVQQFSLQLFRFCVRCGRRSTWTKLLFAILVYTCGSFNAFATDTTWYCSTIFEGAKEPTMLKFEVKDGSLFALTHMQHVRNFLAKYEARPQDIIPKEYKIANDTDKSLIAIYSYPYDERDHTVIDLVLIDKDQENFGRA
jgi:hypothetical protein